MRRRPGPVDLLDAYLATGGYPRLVTEAMHHPTATRFVHARLVDDSSPLVVVGQRVRSSELRDADSDRTGHVPWIGAVKWRATRAMRGDDATEVAAGRAIIPHATAARLLAVCPAGADAGTPFDEVLNASDVLAALR